VARFADAVERGDVDAMVALLTGDAVVTMPPEPLVVRGHDEIAAFLRGREVLRGVPLRVVPVRANSQPAFAAYLPDADGVARPRGLFVLTLEGDAIAAITWFFGTAVFRRFGLPEILA
jgi:RNA polymerase sigma-70 factor (ECF subfamily)